MQLLKDIKTTPFFRFFLPLTTGVIVQLTFKIETEFFVATIVISIFLLVALFVAKINQNYKFRHLTGVLFSIFLFFLGLHLVNFHKTKVLDLPTGQELVFVAQVIEKIQEKPKSLKTILRVTAIIDSTEQKNVEFDLLAYFKKDSIAENLEYGDIIVASAAINEITNLNNPNEFNFKRYLSDKGILYQSYFQTNKWEKIGYSIPNLIKYYSLQSLNTLLDIYRKYGIEGKDFAVLAALTLGYTDELDAETRQAFSASGATHILSVSGLHVAVVYMILNYALFFMNRNKKLRVLKFVIIIFSLWAFAYISGFAASVQRSALMLTIVLIADIFSKQKNIYNTIFASAFILLILDPYVIRDVGFQLSYIAVISIIYLQPKIHKIIYVKNSFLEKIWSLLSVSIAAQLGTLPICLYYFNQFPNYFFITNILAVPLSTVMLYLAVILLAVSFVAPIAKIVAFILNYSTKLFNFIIGFIEQMPYSTTDNISIDFKQMLLLYLFISVLIIFLLNKNRRFLFGSLIIILFFQINVLVRNFATNSQNVFAIYNIKNAPAFNIIFSDRNFFFTDTTLINNPQNITFALQKNWIDKKTATYNLYNIDSVFFYDNFNADELNIYLKNSFLLVGGTKIAILRDKSFAENITTTKLTVDYVVLSKNVYIDISELLANFNFSYIIFDSSNKSNRISKWTEQCEELNIKYHSVPQQGAFILEF